MIDTVATACIVILTLCMLVPLSRIVRGPSIADRVVAADAATTYIMAILVLVCIRSHSRVYFEAVMSLAVLGFFGTVAMAKYILGGRPID